MARPLRIEFAGALYHITARGNARARIFQDDTDRRYFLGQLARASQRCHWLVHGYCLMDNHYHLLIETRDTTLAKGMKYLNGTYSQYFNRQHGRVGHVFQGRYKAILVEKESHLLELSRYVVLNPVRAGMVRSAKDWPWSNYRQTAGLVDCPAWLETDWTLAGFGPQRGGAVQAYRAFVSEGRNQPSPWESLKNQIYLGSDEFVDDMQRQLDPSQPLNDTPRAHSASAPKPLAGYASQYPRDEAMARAYLSGHFSLVTIGAHFGVSYATVSRAVKAYEALNDVKCKA